MADNDSDPLNIYQTIMDDVEYIAEYNNGDDDVIMDDDCEVIEIDPPRSSSSEASGSNASADSNKKRRTSDTQDRAKNSRLAERKKAEGNEAYRNRNYAEACQLYSRAIELMPENACYYSNRSACHMMQGHYRPALEDAQRAVSLDPDFVKGWIRLAKCHVALGAAGLANSVIGKALKLAPNDPSLQQELHQAVALSTALENAQDAALRNEYRVAVFQMDQALRYATGAIDLKITKAEYLAYLGRVSEAEDIVNDILLKDNQQLEAMYVRGLCRYYQDNNEVAFQHFQKVLRMAPDHKKAKESYKRAKSLIQKKEDGNKAFKMGDFQDAIKIYTDCLKIDEKNKITNSKLYCNRGTAAAKLGKMDQSVKDCSSAIELDENYVKAYLRRANSYQQTEQFEEAVRDLEKVYKLQKTPEHKRFLQEAKAQLKKSKRKDYYKILGVEKTANEDEIKKAYRKKALLHHPDRHSNATEEEKAEHERKFKELGEAYAVLTDPKKRQLHDAGHDVNDPDMGAEFSQHFDPSHVMEAFFGQGGGMGGMGGQNMRFGGGAPGGHGGHPGGNMFFNASQMGGFPGGFQFTF